MAITRGIANTGRTIRLPVHAGDTLARLQKARTRLELKYGRPATLDIDEPRRVAEAVEKMALKYAVITSVDRDDLPDGGAGIGLTTPFDGKAATVGNGVMVALAARGEDQVKRLYDLALANGGSDEGPPGDRGGGFYAGYFRDPDGNKLNAFVMKGEG